MSDPWADWDAPPEQRARDHHIDTRRTRGGWRGIDALDVTAIASFEALLGLVDTEDDQALAQACRRLRDDYWTLHNTWATGCDTSG